MVLEKPLENPLDYKEIQPVHPKGNQSWIFIGRTDAEAETPILWSPDAQNWLIGKDPDAEKDWRHEKGMTKDEMVRWHHQLDGYEFEQSLGVGDGQGSLAHNSPWGHKKLDMTECLNWTKWLNRASLYGSAVEESACNIGDKGLIPGSGRSLGEGNGNPLQYSCLENCMDRGAWLSWGCKELDTT